MNATIKLKPRPTNTALIAWQFTGQPLHEWPSWVQSSCSLQRDADGRLELRHERQSGTQIVYLEEWLVRDLDEKGQASIRAALDNVHVRFPVLVELYDNTASLQDRTVDTGIVTAALAKQYGAGGYVGRASGRTFDARRAPGYPP